MTSAAAIRAVASGAACSPCRLFPILFLSFVVFILYYCPAASAAEPERVDIALRHVKWQALPPDVETVYSGPDGRAWYVLLATAPPPDEAALKRIVEREFFQPAPQLRGVEPVLFEPRGRVWFVADISSWPWRPKNGSSADGLFGYDGKKWIVADQDVAGECPGHTESTSRSENLFVDGHAFFLGVSDVACFDGEHWSVKQFPRGYFLDRRGHVLLQPEPDGKGVVALQTAVEEHWGEGGGSHSDPVPSAIWRWRGGVWSQVPAPNNIDKIVQLVPVEGGVWLLRAPGTPQLLFQPYDLRSPDLVRKLARRASDQMAQFGLSRMYAACFVSMARYGSR